MAWIYRNKNGDLMFSKTKPQKIYTYRFKNSDVHPSFTDRYDPDLKLNDIVTIKIAESNFWDDGLYNLYNCTGIMVLKQIYKKDCTFENEYSTGFPVTFKPETIAALKPIVDLENLTMKDGIVEI